MAKIVINDFRGINSTRASLQLKPGEFESSQNFRSRPYTNYTRRQGIDPVSVQTSPVMGIFEIDLDNITIPITQAGSSLEFFPPTGSPETGPTPSVYPPSDPLDPGGNRIFIFPIEQAMRAIQDRRVTAGHAVVSWPNITFNSAGQIINQAVSSYPANGTYGPDMAYYDIYNGVPVGTKAAALVNNVLSACISTVGFNDWIEEIDGETTVQTYDSTIFPSASSATFANFRTVFANLKTGIRLLTTIKSQATQTEVEVRSGTASESDPDCGSCYYATFSPNTLVCPTCDTQAGLDLTFTGFGDGSDPCKYWVVDDTSYSINGMKPRIGLFALGNCILYKNGANWELHLYCEGGLYYSLLTKPTSAGPAGSYTGMSDACLGDPPAAITATIIRC